MLIFPAVLDDMDVDCISHTYNIVKYTIERPRSSELADITVETSRSC